ncbi:Apyrase [Eumeta japonica]|uniref:5'-nucleotidase n=1 Tax=Eumeta variegata TaxID=151549 RepID=A0A4C1TMK0_EUMVA|nr:Apyrase [Eumeta japonica]
MAFQASYTPNTKCGRGFAHAESCLSHKVFIAAQPLPPSPVLSTSKPSPPPLLQSLPSCSSCKPHLVLVPQTSCSSVTSQGKSLNEDNFVLIYGSIEIRAEGENWHHAHFCIINQGGIRADIEPGRLNDGQSPNVYVAAITFEALLLSTPFENRVEVFDLDGQHILEMLEFSVANEPYAGARMLQVSGKKLL